MSHENKTIEERILELTEENNELLKKVRRNQKLTWNFRVVYWTVIILAALGFFYVFKSPLNKVKNEFTGLKSTIENISDKINNLTDVSNIKSLLNNVKR
jgi:hypothetical protein